MDKTGQFTIMVSADIARRQYGFDYKKLIAAEGNSADLLALPPIGLRGAPSSNAAGVETPSAARLVSYPTLKAKHISSPENVKIWRLVSAVQQRFIHSTTAAKRNTYRKHYVRMALNAKIRSARFH